jgi:uncharacterized membrane protein
MKTISYRVLGAGVTAVSAWLLTSEFRLAVSVGLLDTVFKLGAYYAHERVWDRVQLGKSQDNTQGLGI